MAIIYYYTTVVAAKLAYVTCKCYPWLGSGLVCEKKTRVVVFQVAKAQAYHSDIDSGVKFGPG